jgi:endonuclease-3
VDSSSGRLRAGLWENIHEKIAESSSEDELIVLSMDQRASGDRIGHRLAITLAEILERLEGFYGRQEPDWPTDPYLFLVWWHCGYPASDVVCAKGWQSLNRHIGSRPAQLLAAPTTRLANALAAGGMVADVRAQRLQEIATRIQHEFGGDLRRHLLGPLKVARKILKTFPSIGDPGADRILLFAEIAPLAAIPSNCPHVLVRLRSGREQQNYTAIYREAQRQIAAEVHENFQSRKRAYLLLKRHGQELCKSTNPKCDRCPVNSCCLDFASRSVASGTNKQ